MTTIDMHAHVVIRDAIATMRSRWPELAPEIVDEDARAFITYPGRSPMGPFPTALFDVEGRLADMDRQGVDLQVLAVPPPQFHYHLEVEAGVDFARIQNDAVLDLCATHPDRLHAMATLPLQDVDASLDELHRVADQGLLRGVEMGCNVGGTNLDDPTFGPLWSALEAADLPVLFHPDKRGMAGADRMGSYYLGNLIGNPLESTIAAASLIFGGVLDAHPGLRVGFVHGGGFIPYQLGRWDHGYDQRPEASAVANAPPSSYLDRLYFDTLTHDATALRFLAERVGAQQVMLGSDFPFDMSEADPVGALDQAGLDPAARSGVLAANAERFLRPVH